MNLFNTNSHCIINGINLMAQLGCGMRDGPGGYIVNGIATMGRIIRMAHGLFTRW